MAGPADFTAYKDALIVLGAAGVVVPTMQRFRVSPAIGFLAAGAALGPFGLASFVESAPWLRWVTVGGGGEISLLAELGVVFLLFIVGLELTLERLLTMRRLVFGLGGLQMLVSSTAIGLLAWQLGLPPPAAMIVGAALALSSTALVIETLSRRKRLTSASGRASFAVLLLQDLSVVPILLLVALLGARVESGGGVLGAVALALGQALASVAAILVVGRVLLRPLFRMVAGTGSPELFMAAAMFVAIGAGVLAGAAGLSMALGAFLAGLLLAETEYRRAIEATLEPFKGLLLGVFFFSVGMSADIGLMMRMPLAIIGAALGMLAFKTAVMASLARGFGLGWPSAVRSGLLIGSGSEFSFVVVGAAAAVSLIEPDAAAFVLAATTLTMAAVPALDALGDRWARTLSAAAPPPEAAAPPPEDGRRRAIVVGHGRVGRLVCEMLAEHSIPYLAVDTDAGEIVRARRLGIDAYYGDARSTLFLARCGLAEASAVIVTIDTPSSIDEIVDVVRKARKDVPIVARARDALHARKLYALGVNDAVPETIEASLQLSEAALFGLGVAAGPVIASIHEKRDVFRRDLQAAGNPATRAVRTRRKPPSSA
jgi:CPA2 family monovalent cation:H+ antiporter-2